MNPSKLLVTYKNLLATALPVWSRTCTTCPPHRDPIVTVVDASCKIGKILALLLKQNPHIGELRLFDKTTAICGVAEDLSHIDTRTKVTSFAGSTVLKHAITDADVVVTVGGCRTSHKETAKELFERNMDDVRIAALHMIEFNPNAVFCIAKPPIEALVPMVSEEYKKAGVYDSRTIIGITSVGSMRANHYIAESTGQNASEVLCPIVGGLSPNCLVAVLSQARPNTGLSPQNYRSIQHAIGNSEDDILKLYGDCGTVCLTPALAISRFINSLLKALKGDTDCVDCAFVRQIGHIGQFLPYMTSIVRLGRHGVMSTHMPKVNGEETFLLKKASDVILKYIQMGESIITGETVVEADDLISTIEKDKDKQKNEKAACEKVAQKNT